MANIRRLNHIKELQSTVKSFERKAKKCEMEEKSEMRKIKKALEKGNVNCARIFAETVIRKRSEHLNFLRLCSRLNAVVSGLDVICNLSSISLGQNMSASMDRYENLLSEFMRIQVEHMELARPTFFSPPQRDVNSMMQQVADENGLVISVDLPQTAADAVPA